MTRQTINIGSSANDGTGDSLRDAADKINDNFAELYNGVAPNVVSVAGTSKTLALSDAQTVQACSNGSAQTVTIPLNASVAFAVNDTIIFEQHGAGTVTVKGATGVTVNGVAEAGANESAVATTAQYKGGYIRKTATNTWIAVGLE